MDVPDIGGLLTQIAEARDSGELPKTERQHVAPVTIEPAKNIASKEAQNLSSKEAKNLTGKSPKFQNSQTGESRGRKSIKRDDVEYVKTSPRIPKELKKRVDMALIEERFQDAEGRTIKTYDEITALAFERLLAAK